MADNVQASDQIGSSGATFRTDDDGTAHWPYTKIAFGPDNTQTIVADSAGSRVPVEIGELAGTAIAVNAGVLSAGVQRVTIATDDEVNNLLGTIDADTSSMATDLGTIAGAVSTEMQVDIVGITPDLMLGTDFSAVFGAASLVLATQADTVANTVDSVYTSGLGYVFNGTTWDRLRGDATDGVLVNLGTNNDVTANAGTNLNTSTLALEAGGNLATVAGDTTSIDGKITACNTGAVVISSGTVTTVSTVTNLSQMGGQAVTMGEGVVDVGCQRVTLATDDDGVAHLATIAGDTTSIQTAVEIMDDWDDGSDNCSVIQQGGFVLDGTTRCEIKHFHSVTSTSDTSIITAVSLKRFRILSMTILGLSATATNVHLETKTTNTDCFGDSTNPIPIAVDADGDNTAGFVLPFNQGGWFETADADEDMAIILSAAQPVLICGNYIEVT